ncbi:hypothetical protein EIN_069030 [Entamoeba invadens IP1]|uniref:Leucine rich repeat containing protein BspA family protein n=2 Tax=Entamoeba invadens TaxID=33085 RepID=A0A0A1TUC2_ENTIV|nr:hypothetical protein EIN_069030 [Entamoeba invadens IP1]ELP83549.1 hypothetical protein EIN_069030 [Entamoeba invadens IP1]BAN41240.1 hypothetical protein, conserved [Entamoeba invadens]|eukprot:XP_004182895.1 hypothetical protein EIN_069030 [Entamoeba invadens IP1]
MTKLEPSHLTLVLKYLKTPDDYVKISQVSKKVVQSISFLTSNPVPIPPQYLSKFFPKATEINVWDNEQLTDYLTFADFDILSKRYLNILFEVDYTTAKSLQSDSVVLKKVTFNATDRKTYGSNFKEFSELPHISALDDCCFENENNIKSVDVPQTVTRLGNKCFSSCSSLDSVVFSKHLLEIGDECFAKCNNLISIEIPSTVTLLGDSSFQDCGALDLVNFSNYDQMPMYNKEFSELGCLTEIKTNTFNGCTRLQVVEIPKCVASLGDKCFSGCSDLGGITIPKGLTFIGPYCFEDNSTLTELTIPTKVDTIGEGAFKGCGSLKELTISGNGIANVGDSLFEGCSSLKQFNVSQYVKSIGIETFKGCENLREIVIPSNVSSIGDNCFENCKTLKEITLNEGLLSIGNYCFKNCTSLTEVELPKSIRKRGRECFPSGITVRNK